MTPDELIADCRKQQALLGKPDVLMTYLLAKPKKWGNATYAPLWKGGPRGRIVADQIPGPGVIAMFRADEVITAVEKAMAPPPPGEGREGR